jgi:hypothetical protein
MQVQTEGTDSHPRCGRKCSKNEIIDTIISVTNISRNVNLQQPAASFIALLKTPSEKPWSSCSS